MSNDPAALLRESEQVEISAVLEVGQGNKGASIPLMLTDPVVIPVELEWVGGDAHGSSRRAAPRDVAQAEPGPIRPPPMGHAPVGHAPVLAHPPRRHGRFVLGN